MNFTQSFEEFSKGLVPMDLILYAGIALVVWVLFKDKLGPVQGVVNLFWDNINKLLAKKAITPVLSTTRVVEDNTPPILATIIAENSAAKTKLSRLIPPSFAAHGEKSVTGLMAPTYQAKVLLSFV